MVSSRLRSSRDWIRRKRSDVPDFGDPIVKDLSDRYRQHPAAAHTWWNEGNQRQGLGLPDYRSDNLYVWQRGVDDDAYRESWEYARAHDHFGITDRVAEDGRYGVHTVDVDGRVVSRDLIDSVLELQHLAGAVPGFAGPDPFTVLDIGAGYGRLADRATAAFTHLEWLCVDAVPISTAICAYHLDRVGSRAEVIALDEVESLAAGSIDLAVNVHSFNECSAEAIGWWADFLASREVPRLFIVPNDTQWLETNELDGSRQGYEPVLVDAGYTLVDARHKYRLDASLQRDGLFPEKYLMFELQR